MKTWSAIYDRLGDIGVAAVGLDGSIVRCNSSYARVFNADPHNMVGRSIVALTAAADQPRTEENLIALREGLIDDVRHAKQYNAGGNLVSKMLTKLLIRDDRGRPFQLLCFIYDYSRSDSDTEKAERMERLLCEVLNVVGHSKGVQVNVTTGNDNIVDSQNIEQTTNRTSTTPISPRVLLVAIVAVAVMALGTVAIMSGGRFAASRTKIEIEGDLDAVPTTN